MKKRLIRYLICFMVLFEMCGCASGIKRTVRRSLLVPVTATGGAAVGALGGGLGGITVPLAGFVGSSIGVLKPEETRLYYLAPLATPVFVLGGTVAGAVEGTKWGWSLGDDKDEGR
jgi:hypothetical protein